MLKRTILIISLLMILAGCAGKSEPESDIYKGFSDKSYSEQDTKYYGPDGEGNCFYHGTCGQVIPSNPIPPLSGYNPTSPGIPPPVSQGYYLPQTPLLPPQPIIGQDEESEPSNYKSRWKFSYPPPEENPQPSAFINSQTGDSYLRLGNDENSWYVGPKGDTIMPFGSWKIDQKGNTYTPFGNGYIDSKGTYYFPMGN